jgi:Tfp pilus assembly pilus retraction ATPase PilT
MNQIRNVIYTYRSSGMCLLEDYLLNLVEEWLITPEAALFNANDRDYISRSLSQKFK